MSRAKFIRWKPASLLLAFLLVVLMPLVPVATSYADDTETQSDYWKIVVCVTVPKGQTAPSTDAITGTDNVTANKSSSANGCASGTTAYVTGVQSDSHAGNVPPPQLQECDALTGKCTTINGGNPESSNPSVATISGNMITTSSSSAASGNDSSDTNPDALSCTSGGGFFTAVLNWILCGTINLAWGAANLLDNWIMSTLNVDVTSIFDNTGNANSASHGYYLAWNAFRIIATAILIMGGLIMVTAQALGFEALDAYTIRKVLPRLLIAVIGISLSWALMRFVVDFFDTAGLDIREIMYAPFHGMGGKVSAGTGILATLTVGATIFVMGPASLTFLLTCMLAAFIGFLILVIRQIAIVMLVILAPIAIACYILPNTHRVWKLWYDNFLGLMLMFPIISALIAAGHIFSAVTLQGGSGVGNGVVAQAIGLIAYFAPYFMLPMAARFATGAIGNIAGFVNDRHRGAFKYLGDRRSAARQRNIANMQAGNRFNHGGLNALTARATTRGLGLTGRGKQEYDNKMQLAAAEFSKSRHGMGAQFKDDVNQAGTYRSEAEARRRLATDFGVTNPADVEAAIAGVKASGGFGVARQVWSAKQLAATGTGYDDEAHMLSTIARVSGDNNVLADSMWGEMRGTSERAGRNDLKAGYTTGTSILRNLQQQNARRGSAGPVTAADMEADTSAGGFQAQLQDFGVEAARGVDNYSAMSRNKPKSIGNLTKRMDQARSRYQGVLDRETVAPGSVDAGQLEQARVASGQIQAKMENLAGYKGSGPEVNAEALYGNRGKAEGSQVGDIRLSGERDTLYTRAHAAAEYATFSGEERAAQAHVEESGGRGGGHGFEEDAHAHARDEEGHK